ncbi:MAG TPA: hypothetical protein VFL78_11705 [Rhodanobacteraceae bacterium]|nr:hypothetical protein [Rhodanobacteraceae bacterium]
MSRKKKENRFDDIDGKAAFIIPLTLLRHPNWINLSPHGNKLIMDLGRQFTGYNNGYLCASWAIMQDHGWNSPTTLHKAMLECEHYGLIVRTQHGSLNKPNLHAFTWRRIDEKPGQPLEMTPTDRPTNAWKDPRVKFVYEKPERSQSHRSRRQRRAA